MNSKNSHVSLTALMVAGVLAAGCGNDVMGPEFDPVQVSQSGSPRVKSIDRDFDSSLPNKMHSQDLAVRSVETTAPGEVTVVIRNEGPGFFYGPIEVGLLREYGEFTSQVSTVQWGDENSLLAPGKTVVVTIQRGDCGGSMRYHVVVDPDNRIPESNDDNNRSPMFFLFGCS